jgi:hypothetical protein
MASDEAEKQDKSAIDRSKHISIKLTGHVDAMIQP